MHSAIKRILRQCLYSAKHSIIPVTNEHALDVCLDLLGVRHVMDGPFRGMAYVKRSHGSAYYPKLLGTYERELGHLWTVEHLERFRFVADIGCAEGYYLAGIHHLLSRRSNDRETTFVGYDISSTALAEARNLLTLNGVKNYELKRSGLETDLSHAPTPALLICDIEGSEREVLAAGPMKALAQMHIIVEVHDEPGSSCVLDLLMTRFSATHEIERFSFHERTISDFPNLPWPRVGRQLKLELMAEGRKYGNNWLCMVPRQ
jgi:hypothetical protein